jgi:hypothetical protein
MAEHKVQGGNMLLFIDPNGGTDYDLVVCLTSVGVSMSVGVVDASSACGPDKSPGALEISYTFEGQHLQDPDTGKISGTNLRLLLNAEQTIGWKLAPETPVEGDEIQEGTGFISELSSTYAFDSVGTFTASIMPFGEPTVTIFGGGGGLVVGQAYEGGTIAYIDGTGIHGIIIAWNDLTHINVWGGTGYVVGANFDTLYNGVVNSDLIAAAFVTAAAWDCTNLVQGGYSDWCLPTASDWYAMQPNCATVGIDASTTYWTSIENTGDPDNAIGFNPIINSGLIVGKGGSGSYIAVRYF